MADLLTLQCLSFVSYCGCIITVSYSSVKCNFFHGMFQIRNAEDVCVNDMDIVNKRKTCSE